MTKQQGKPKLQMTSAMATQLLQQERQARLESCGRALEAVLKKHQCQLIAVARLTPDGRITAITQIAPIEETNAGRGNGNG